jgi:hypothetical protein
VLAAAPESCLIRLSVDNYSNGRLLSSRVVCRIV